MIRDIERLTIVLDHKMDDSCERLRLLERSLSTTVLGTCGWQW